jgi:hypothetical protein
MPARHSVRQSGETVASARLQSRPNAADIAALGRVSERFVRLLSHGRKLFRRLSRLKSSSGLAEQLQNSFAAFCFSAVHNSTAESERVGAVIQEGTNNF